MYQKNLNKLFFAVILIFLPACLLAQSMVGKRIFVSPSQEVMIKFPAVITNYNIQNKESANLFETRITNNRNLSINSNIQNFKSTNLVVNEGGNTHIFILEYKETLDGIQESLYDFSKRKTASAEAKRLEELNKSTANASSSGGNTAKTNPPATSSTTPVIDLPANSKENEYYDVIRRADSAYLKGNYDVAKQYYTTAQRLNPNDNWASQQLGNIELRIKSGAKSEPLKANDAAYLKHIKTGDSAFNKKLFPAAKAAYVAALNIKNTDRYAASQIVKVEKALNEEDYTRLMKFGKEALSNKLLPEAEAAFTDALKKKGNDTEAKKMLEVVRREKTMASKRQEAETTSTIKLNQFRDTLQAADQLFRQARYDDAKKLYQKADRLKPGEAYALSRIKQIDSILVLRKSVMNKMKKDSADLLLYNGILDKAGKALDAGDLKKAKSLYIQAQTLRPDEKLPAQKISSIDVMLADEDAKKRNAAAERTKTETENKQYNTFIKQGNAAAIKKQYAAATDYYLQARAIKPGESYPRTQIELLSKKMEEIRNEEKYKEFIHLADSTAFQAGDQLAALRIYDSARALKPAEVYPRKQIISINDQLRKAASRALEQQRQKERTEQFNMAFENYRKGDDSRLQRKYPEAYTAYSKFLQQLDTTNLTGYLSTELFYINLAKDYIRRLETYKPKPVVDTIKTAPADDKRRRRNRKTTAGTLTDKYLEYMVIKQQPECLTRNPLGFAAKSRLA
jgi:hypothetical protein